MTDSSAKASRRQVMRASTLGLYLFPGRCTGQGFRRPRPCVDTGEPCQGDDVEQGGLDVAVPVIGEKQVGQMSLRKKL
jgi:hypothetical protein